MKILMLTPYLPYPDSSGGQIRTQNLLKHLKKWHEITLFSLIKNPEEEKYISILEKDFCHKVKVFKRSQKPWTLKNILKTGFSAQPFLVVRNFSEEAKAAITRELSENNYDLIHVETFYAMPHIPNTKVPVVLVDQTIEYQVYDHYVHHTAPFFLRPLFNIDVKKLKYWETFYWRQADRVVAVSEADKNKMIEVEPEINVDVVPNGVNLDLFKKKTSWSSKTPTLLFVSNFNWLQNTEAAQYLINDVFPLVKEKIDNAQVRIVGQHIPKELREKESRDIKIKEVAEDDVQSIVEAYHDADVFVTPLKGPGGTRLKNFAAMASQLPIVSTSVGMSGLGVKDGEHVFIADSWGKMADAVVRILNNAILAQKLALNSRLYIEKNYDYQIIAKHLSDIYQDTAHSKNG